jgi:hypothetical protein
MWRILDENDKSELFSCLELRGGSLHLYRLRTDRLALVSKFDYVLTRMRFMGPTKLVASTAAKLDDTSPLLQ